MMASQDQSLSADTATAPRTAWIRLGVIAAIALAIALSARPDEITSFYLVFEDRWLLLGEALALGTCTLFLGKRSRPLALPAQAVLALAAIAALLCLAGHYLILAGHDLTRDEQMANFDAAILRGGHLVQTLPADWRDHAAALNHKFMLPADHRLAWVSAYLPGNAALRALIGLIASPALTGPMLTALGGLALWGCARRIWTENREPATVATLLYFGSGQVLMTGMTAYAMPAHLALNLVWLWLYLGATWRRDMAALAVGFLATGLHQPLFHPLFAAPFLALLILPRQRDWRRAALYAAGYAAIGLFWLAWPGWIWAMVQQGAAVQPAGVDYLTRLQQTVGEMHGFGLIEMIANLLRFAAWQHLLLVPLALLGARLMRRDPLVAALAAGPLLTVAVMTLILPNQGHGFGYRYLHGLIGNLALLAVFGWMTLGAETARWRTLLVRATAVGWLAVLPVQAWLAHQAYAPFAAASNRISGSGSDFAVIGSDDVPFASDLVINPPQLDRRPTRLLRDALDAPLIAQLCASHPRVAVLGNPVLQPIADRFDTQHPRADAANAEFSPRLTAAGCRVEVLR